MNGNTKKKQYNGVRNAVIATLIVCIIAELIGPLKFRIKEIDIQIGTLIWAIILAILLSPDLLGRVIPKLKEFIGEKEIKISPQLLALTLYPLGIMFGISAGPQIGVVLRAGPALLLQEAGNIMTMLIALPVAMMIGLGRTSVGATFSLCRDTALGIIGDKYGLESPEGMGTLGVYISGSVFGTIFYSILAPIGLAIGFHPYALAMASGMGSASMMGAATTSLINSTAPVFHEQILAYSATSGLLTAVTGIYVEIFIALPLANFYYNKLSKLKFGKKKNIEGES